MGLLSMVSARLWRPVRFNAKVEVMRKVIDAEYEVVSGPVRIGDPHPLRKRWRYAGLDGYGRALWYRPPRFNRWQVFLLLCVGVLAARAAVYLGADLIHHLRTYWPG